MDCTLIQLLRDLPDHHRIVNVDQSCWRLYLHALQTWAPTGAQNILLAVDGKEKDSLTVVAAITAAHTKFPLFLIAAGKTDRVEQFHLGDVAHHQTAHSQSGWQTAEAFQQWLRWLRSCYGDGEAVWLVLGCYSVHRQPPMRQYADDRGIHLLFITPGLTDDLQPLDRYVFEAMRGLCRRLYRMHCESTGSDEMTQQVAITFLLRAWEQVSPQTLEDA
jgi:hypothetical protein